MHEHLVKVLILMRAICGTRVTLLFFGTREYTEMHFLLTRKSVYLSNFSHLDVILPYGDEK